MHVIVCLTKNKIKSKIYTSLIIINIYKSIHSNFKAKKKKILLEVLFNEICIFFTFFIIYN
jgi:hypothetical protein